VKHRLATLAVAVAVFGAAPAVAPVLDRSALGAPAASAKSCSSGYKHAVLGGSHKCLRRGQFCARAKDSTYHRYGFHCHKRDARGNYHLT
jgi:hypothetical protein